MAEPVTIDPVRAGRSREGGFDCGEQFSPRPLQAAHFGIGIEHRDAGVGKHLRDGRFAPCR